MNFALKPSFWMIRAYFRDARRESSSDFAPVTTILPDAKIRAVVFGSRILIITAANRYVSIPQGHGDLRVIFCVSGVQSDGFQIEATIQVDGSYDIPSTSLATRTY